MVVPVGSRRSTATPGYPPTESDHIKMSTTKKNRDPTAQAEKQTNSSSPIR
jgi:hypothetical protein